MNSTFPDMLHCHINFWLTEKYKMYRLHTSSLKMHLGVFVLYL